MSNNITKQVITELETIKAIASELADMSPRTQMEVVALCKEICLNVDKVLEAHDLDITTLFNYINVIESELEEIRQLIDPQHLASIDERLEDLEASILTINESIGGINETLLTHTSQIQGLETSKQNVLTAGVNIQINNGVISATDTTYTAGENITIENGVISASGGGSELYEHNIQLFATYYLSAVSLKIITNDNTPFTWLTLGTWLNTNGFSYFETPYPASGTMKTANNKIKIVNGVTKMPNNSNLSFLGATITYNSTTNEIDYLSAEKYDTPISSCIDVVRQIQ